MSCILRKSIDGQGIGRRAMEFVEAAAAELGVNAIHLEVTHGNDPAIGLYRRAGYSGNERFLMTKWFRLGNGKSS